MRNFRLPDLAPTLLEAVGIPIYEGMQGKSFWKILSGETNADKHRENVYYEYYNSIPSTDAYEKCNGAYITGVRDDKFAITCAHNLDTGELYDLGKDPGMVHNLWEDETYVSIKAMMLKKLCDRMAETIDPLPKTEAAY